MNIIQEKTITDKELSNIIIGCPSYKEMDGLSSRFEWLHEVLMGSFNEFQLHKMNNDVYYFEHNMLRNAHIRLLKYRSSEYYTDYYKDYIKACIKIYYKLFKGSFYKRYKLLSFTLPYNTECIPLEYNIKGQVDLVIKTSFGKTLLNYVFYLNNHAFYYNVCLEATKLQIAGRCIKLITGIQPDLLCLIIFHKNIAFKKYFKYLDEPYEEFLKIYKNDLLPIKRKYSALCNTCNEQHCSPWKTKESVLI